MEVGQHEKTKRQFEHSTGLTSARAAELLHEFGRNEILEKVTPSWLIFLQGLWGPMPGMIWLAAIIELALQNFIDGGILCGILLVNALIGWHERTKSGNAVAALKKSLQAQATVNRDGKWQTMDAALIVPGDLVKLASGSAVPADCLVNEGSVDADQSSLTGESLPVTLGPGDSALMGTLIVRGETDATVEHTGVRTYFGRTAELLNQSAGDEGGNIKKIILRITVILSVASVVFTLISFIYLLAKGIRVIPALDFAVVVIVASIPLAVEVVVTTTLALGANELSKHKAIVARLAAIEELAGVDILCSDKTGTLTLNKMEIQEKCPIFVAGNDRHSVLVLAALAAKWRDPPRDALDTMVLGSADLDECDKYEQLEYLPFDPVTKRTYGKLKNRATGEVFEVSKGAPHIILDLVKPTPEVRSRAEEIIAKLGVRGIRSLAVARTYEDEWELVGLLTFLDPPRPDTKRTIERAYENGVEVKMITGDHVLIAKEMARMLRMGTNILGVKELPHEVDGKDKELGKKYGALIMASNGFAQVHPEHKFLIVEALRQLGHRVAMTGDGVNDAPALKRADVGIAVSGATDAARSAAAIVLTEPGLSTVIEAMLIARGVFQRIRSFLMYRISATVQLLMFFFIAVFAFDPSDYPREGETESYEKFFHLPVIMLMLITVLNDGTLLTIGYDNVNPPHYPMHWNMRALFAVAVTMSCVALLSSLLLLWFIYDSIHSTSVFRGFGMPEVERCKVVTMMYLKVSVSDFLTLFSARTNDQFFWHSMPNKLLFIGAFIALLVSSLLAAFWPYATLDDEPVCGCARGDYQYYPLWIWIYCLVWWLIQDAVKVYCFHLIAKYKLFNYRQDTAPQLAVEQGGEGEHHGSVTSIDDVIKKAASESLARAQSRRDRAAKPRNKTLMELRVEPDPGLRRVSSINGFPHEYAFEHHVENGLTSADVSRNVSINDLTSLPADAPVGSSEPLPVSHVAPQVMLGNLSSNLHNFLHTEKEDQHHLPVFAEEETSALPPGPSSRPVPAFVIGSPGATQDDEEEEEDVAAAAKPAASAPVATSAAAAAAAAPAAAASSTSRTQSAPLQETKISLV